MIAPIENVLVAVPTRGTVQWGTVTRLQEIRDENPGLPPIVYQPGAISVALTRNKIVRRFLAGPWTVLAMVDDDIAPPNNFLDLRERLEDYAMVGVPHPLQNQQEPTAISLAIYERTLGGYKLSQELRPGVNDCDALGTGCVVIRRDVFDTLGPAPFRVDNDPDADVQGEDFLFCQDLHEAGLRVGYELPGGHFGDHHTSLSLAPLLKENLNVDPSPAIYVPNRAQRRQLARQR